MSYHQLYGPTRRERGRRMAANESPAYTDPPPVTWKTFRPTRGAYRYWFDGYVEDIVRTRNVNGAVNRADRPWLVVRSQKTRGDEGALYLIQGVRRGGWVPTADVMRAMRIDNWRALTCTCQDTDPMCKHKYAAIYKYSPAALLRRSVRLRR